VESGGPEKTTDLTVVLGHHVDFPIATKITNSDKYLKRNILAKVSTSTCNCREDAKAPQR
jgi:hypothetical protein